VNAILAGSASDPPLPLRTPDISGKGVRWSSYFIASNNPTASSRVMEVLRIAFRVIDRAIQAFGGSGVTSGYGRAYAYATHGESTFPQSRKILAEILAGVPEDDRPSLPRRSRYRRRAPHWARLSSVTRKSTPDYGQPTTRLRCLQLMPTNPQMIDMPEGDTLAPATSTWRSSRPSIIAAWTRRCSAPSRAISSRW
jgi:hypothetical protein